MHRVLYSLLLYLALPLLVLRLLFRSIKSPPYLKRWGERFGLAAPPQGHAADQGCLWIHAVSVGETLAAAPLIRQLQSRHPGQQILVTTMTPTGSERVLSLFGDSVVHVYLPYDYPGAVRRFVDLFRPGVLVVMETELWPNLVHYCHIKGVKILLANARMSEKSARGYRRWSALSRQMMSELDLVAAQSPEDAERLISLGVPRAKASITGSIKFDMEVPGLPAADLPPGFRQIRDSGRLVLVAASTREGEEQKVLDAYRQCLAVHPGLILVLVPRHPQRADSVQELCQQAGMKTVRRSTDFSIDSATRVLLGDTIGEMWYYLALADVAFVGGSLVNTGCHNVLEPAALGIPVLAGPSQFNFAAICQELELSGALKTVADGAALATQVNHLLSNPDRRTAMGTAGKAVVARNRGSLQKQLALVEALMPDNS